MTQSTPAVILNVDDNEAVRYARGRVLRAAGYVVYDASTGQQTLEAVRRLCPDLVVLDVHLPDASGIDICRQLKSDPSSGSVLVLQVSASSAAVPNAKAALDSGADTYLTEPVDNDVLVATVRALLRLGKAEREARQVTDELRHANARLEEINRDLLRSNEDLQQFANIASHDLQEPLRTITTFLQLIERRLRDRLTAEEQGFLVSVVDGAARMRRLIDDLLAYSRLGYTRSDLSVVNLTEVLRWAMSNMKEAIEKSGATIQLESLPPVWGEFTQLAQVFQNLLSNAIKYRSRDRDIVVHVSAQRNSEEEWIIRVSDNGQGIQTDYLETIFAPFKRLHGRDIPGTGIGLAICRRIVQGLGGRIWAESEPGKGATFCLGLGAIQTTSTSS